VPGAGRDPPGVNGEVHPERRTRKSIAEMVARKTGFFISSEYVPQQIK
jgi:hypothetical protein